MKLPRWSVWVAASLFVLVLAGCEGGGGTTTALGPTGSEEDATGTGTLSLMLTDAPTDDLQAVYVTIDEVQVHMADGENGEWEPVVNSDPKKTFNLLELRNGVMEQLGVGVLAPGTYTQMRLIIGLTADDGDNILDEKHPSEFDGNYVIDKDDNYVDLKVPSGVQTGIKLVHPFVIQAELTTELILDFDAAKSVHKAGNSEKYILKPTIKVIGTHAVIDGTVTDGQASLEDVQVSAQTYDDNADPLFDERDRIIVHASSKTDSNGYYAMHLPDGFYCLVYYKGYSPVDENDFGMVYGPYCSTYQAFMDTYEPLPDVQLDPVDTGNLIVEIIPSAGEEGVTVSFRQAGCDPSICEDIEVWWDAGTANASAVPYTLTAGLPDGVYDVVAFTETDTLGPTVAAVTADYTSTVSFDFAP